MRNDLLEGLRNSQWFHIQVDLPQCFSKLRFWNGLEVLNVNDLTNLFDRKSFLKPTQQIIENVWKDLEYFLRGGDMVSPCNLTIEWVKNMNIWQSLGNVNGFSVCDHGKMRKKNPLNFILYPFIVFQKMMIKIL